MMKFKRWKKMIVMLIAATMFLQSVVVYADDGTLTPVVETKTESQTTVNSEQTTGETPAVTTSDETPSNVTPGTAPEETLGEIIPGGVSRG